LLRDSAFEDSELAAQFPALEFRSYLELTFQDLATSFPESVKRFPA
jgi:hypothetical protein